MIYLQGGMGAGVVQHTGSSLSISAAGRRPSAAGQPGNQQQEGTPARQASAVRQEAGWSKADGSSEEDTALL